jgi:hypothetical protein
MEAAGSSETLVPMYHTTRHHVPEIHNFNTVAEHWLDDMDSVSSGIKEFFFLSA